MISVVIPALNEERALPETLRSVTGQAGDLEVIVVDGGSRDATCRIVEEHAFRESRVRLLSAPRGRASQMNAGALEARGEWLLFLHADSALAPGALERIADLPTDVRAGCFHQRFSGKSRKLRTLSWLHNRRFHWTRVIYGDQALYVRRELFHELRGFPVRPMEDVAFSIELRRVTRPVMLPQRVTTAARKFDQMGHFRALGHCISLLVRFRVGKNVDGDAFFGDFR